MAVNSTQEPDLATGRRNEWLLVTFTGSTNLADAVIRVALPLLALQVTHSPLAITAVASLISLPWLLSALHIGVFVDRANRRSLMFGAETVRLASAAVLLTAVLTDSVNMPLIYVTALVLGLAEVVAVLSGASIVPSAIPRTRWQTALSRITATEALCNSFLGAPVGGLLVAAGFGIALGVTGVVYLAGAILLLMLAGNFAVAPTQERRPVHTEIKDGMRFLLQHRLLRTMAGLITIMAGCWAAWLALIPAYAVGGPLGLDAQQYGFLLTCLGAGGVLGTVLVGPVNRLVGRRWAMLVDIIGSFALVGVPAVLPATPSSAWAIGAAAFVAGAGGTMWTVNSRVITQSFVPNDMLGRFSAASRVVAWGMAPVAAAAAGALAQLVSYQVAFGTFALLCLLLIHPFLRVITTDAIADVGLPVAADAEPAVAVPVAAGPATAEPPVPVPVPTGAAAE
jgi:MFS family permease